MSSICTLSNSSSTITLSIDPTNQVGVPPYYQTVTLWNLKRRQVSAQSYQSPAYAINLMDTGSYYVVKLGNQAVPSSQFLQLSIPYGCHQISIQGAGAQQPGVSIPINIIPSQGMPVRSALPLNCANYVLVLNQNSASVSCGSTSTGQVTTTQHIATLSANADGTTQLHLSAPL